MIKKLQHIFILAGICLIIYGAMLYHFADLPKQVGLIFNITLLVVDVLWSACLGLFLIITGLSLNDRLAYYKVLIGGHCVIFTSISLLMSVIYNFIIKPVPHSFGRIVTFHVQTVGKLIFPSLSPEFFILLIGILTIFIAMHHFHISVLRKLEIGKE